MSNAARSFGRTTLVAFAALVPAMLLASCGNSNEEQLAAQVADAKQAAERAEAAQKAAESAAKAIIAKAPPGSFGADESGGEFSDTTEYESTDPTDSTGGMDLSFDGGSSSGSGSSSGVPN